ncbi:MAG TPA: helix-hairpin-helix domain-containing protein [Nitrospirota bacterium]
MRSKRKKVHNERGVALIIVLLVTALLIALIFEFAYGTRVSMRGTVNFRDSQRAYYLARSGVNFVGLLLNDNLKKGKLQENIEQRDWQAVPILTEASDTELKVRWEDEGGKINVTNLTRGSDGYNRLGALFEMRGVNRDILDQISAWMIEEKRNFNLLTELHRFLSDEEFRKVQDGVTVYPLTLVAGNKININTASVDVLQSVGLNPGMAGMIKERRDQEPFKTPQEISDFLGPSNVLAAGQLADTSDVFKVASYATVGGYTKQVEAIIRRTSSGFSVSYWRVL